MTDEHVSNVHVSSGHVYKQQSFVCKHLPLSKVMDGASLPNALMSDYIKYHGKTLSNLWRLVIVVMVSI